MPLSEFAYRSALEAAHMAAPVLSLGGSKLARGLRGRRGATARLLAWAAAERDTARPLLWLHAPSVGEGLQARAVLDAVRARAPEVQSVFTHFSPSAEPLASRMGTDAADYLPWDLPGEMRALAAGLSPTVLAFTKTEVWPTLAREAAQRGTGLVLIAATLPAGSSRLSPLARTFLRPAFSRLDEVHAISDDDGRRFARLGVDLGRVTVTGDPGIDSAAERAAAADPAAPYLRALPKGRPRLVAGSTWPADEAVLLPACARLRDSRGPGATGRGAPPPGLQIVLAPHEPTPAHVAALVRRLGQEGWHAAPLAEVEAARDPERFDAVVVDRVGILAHLYTTGTVAYVGGGFHDKGLHSVLEPAAVGVPVCFGPRHGNARAAGELLAAGGGREVAGVEGLVDVLTRWAQGERARSAAGAAAADYVSVHRGAARRSAALLVERLRR